ncbi:vascular cell adhesion protein 1-like, partial [Acanthopagrus schlegelii]
LDAPRLPSVSVSPSAEIVEGSSVTLTCSSDANPAANYTWYKENGDPDLQPLIKDPQLVFSSIQSSDSGEYYCTAENQLGRRMSEYIYVNVTYAPRLPSVSVSPSAEIVEGSSVTLTCSSDANPAANYTWYKENEDSPKASGQIFTITDFRAEHSGNYSCEVQNTRGRHNSTLQLIVVAGSLTMMINIIRLILVVLMSVLLLLFCLWMRKKKTLSSTTEPNEPIETVEMRELESDPDHTNISPLKREAAACGRSSEVLAGPPTEFCRELVAWEPMKGVWQQTTSARPSTEEQALDLVWDLAGPPIKVQALDLAWTSARPPIEVQILDLAWDSPGPPTEEHLDRQLKATALQVQVTRITVHQSDTEAELKCHSSCSPAARLSYVWFKNGQKVTGVETSSFKGRVYPGDIISCALKGHENYGSPSVYAPRLPSVSVSPSAEIVEGSSVTLTCSSDANPAANYTWYKENGDPDLQPLSKDPQLVFSSIQSSDSGEYYCTAENQLGRRTSEYIYINVTYGPRLPSVSVSPSAEIVEGSSVTLTCSSDANPAANYTWYKENQTLIQGPEGIYNFSSISSEDRGNYSCKSENKYGQTNSTSVFIDVQYAPRLPSVSVSPSAEIVEGSSVTLTCSSDANPAGNYTWYKENEDSPKASGQIFTITDFRAEHSGNYYCEAQNRRGRHNSTLQLTVVAATWKLPVALSTTAVILIFMLLLVFFGIRRVRSSQQQSEADERPDNRAQTEELHYGSVRFIRTQADTLHSDFSPARPHRNEEESVVYAATNFIRSSRRVRSSQQQSEADERQDNRAQTEELHYGSVQFIRTQADTLHSDFSPARPHRNEEESVVYATTNFIRSSRSNHQAAVEDPSALYSRVTKSH